MANYEILNLEVKTIAKGPNKGNEYLIGAVKNMLDVWADPVTITVFNTQQIAFLKPFIPKAKGGLSEEKDLHLPEEYRIIKGGMFTYVPPKEQLPLIRIYTTTDASRGWVAGEPILNKNTGKPNLYTQIHVFCRYYIDPERGNDLQFSKGESPEEKGRMQVETFYITQREYLAKKGIQIDEPDDEPDEIEPDATWLKDPNSGKLYKIENGQIIWKE